MYLGTVYVRLDLEPEVTSHDRERLLRAVRDKLKHAFGQRLSLKSDGEAAIMAAFFDEGFGRARSLCDQIIERIESSGEARIAFSQGQVFAWFEGGFRETRDELDSDDDAPDDEGDMFSRQKMRFPTGRGQNNVIRYSDDDEESTRPTPIPSRFGRKGVKPSDRR